MKKIIFRADGNNATGLGHLYRVFALIEMYKDSFDCVLLTSQTSALHVIPKNYNLTTIPASLSTSQEPAWLAEQYRPETYRIIADGYQFNAAYQEKIKDLGYHLTYIDDLTTEFMHADVVINHSMSAKVTDYRSKPDTRFCLGTRYAILRPQFLEAAKQQRKITEIDTAFVCFGGSDQLNLSLTAVKALLNIGAIKKINVVLGGAYQHSEIFELAKLNPKINVNQDLDETALIAIMKECNLGIAPASNILYELCAVKMPLLSGFYIENQKMLYQGCVDNQIIFGGGNLENYSEQDFKGKISEILVAKDYVQFLAAQAKLFNSGIKSRFLRLAKEIKYRQANAGDMQLVYGWANDQLTRSNSYATEIISLETHQAWFEKKIRDKDSLLFIAEVQNKPAGLIRYDLSANGSIVGIMIGDEFRGQGLASEFLTDSAKLYFSENRQPITAYIKKSNLASVRSFENANYKKVKEQVIQGVESFVYVLESETESNK